MAMLAGVAVRLRDDPPQRGRVALLFQPAEETGVGARRVAADPRYRALAPDWIFAVHNLPGYPLGAVALGPGPLAAASVGLAIHLRGRTAHAAQPEQGRSPAAAAARLIPRLAALGAGAAAAGRLALVTVVHVRIGERAFGTAPGAGDLLATLRADSDAGLADLRRQAEAAAREEAQRDGLQFELSWHDPFPATVNDPAAVALAEQACSELGCGVTAPRESPFRWSEDLGWLLRETPGALVGLGAGSEQPALHAPDYDFPDELLPVGVGLLTRLAELGIAAPRPDGRGTRE
jgi:amidohydrolase